MGAGSYHNTWYPRGKLPPNPQTNTNPNPNPNLGEFSSGAIVWLPPPTLKLTLTLTENRNPNRGRGGGGQFSMGDNTVQDRIWLKSQKIVLICVNCLVCTVLQCALCKIRTTDFKIRWNVRKWLCRRTSSKQS